MLTRAQKRLVRYSFTFIGLYLYTNLLGWLRDLKSVEANLSQMIKNNKNLKVDSKKTESQYHTTKKAVNILKGCVDALSNYILVERSKDTKEIVRHSVYEFLAKLDSIDLVDTFNKRNPKIFDTVFEGLRDSEVSIRRTCLSIIHSLLENVKSKEVVAILG